MTRSLTFALLAVGLSCILLSVAAFMAFADDAVAPINQAPPADAVPPAAVLDDTSVTSQGSNLLGPHESFVAQVDQAWRAVERIDNKLANAVIFLTVFAALIPLFIAIYEFLKVKELEEIKSRIPEFVSQEVNRCFDSLEKRYLTEVSKMLHSRIENETETAIKFLHDDDVQVGRAMIAFLNNEMSPEEDAVKVGEIIRLFEFQRQLRNLASEIDADVRHALTYFHGLAPTLSKSTAFEVMDHLKAIEEHGGISSLDARIHWGNVVKEFRKTHRID